MVSNCCLCRCRFGRRVGVSEAPARRAERKSRAPYLTGAGATGRRLRRAGEQSTSASANPGWPLPEAVHRQGREASDARSRLWRARVNVVRGGSGAGRVAGDTLFVLKSRQQACDEPGGGQSAEPTPRRRPMRHKSKCVAWRRVSSPPGNDKLRADSLIYRKATRSPNITRLCMTPRSGVALIMQPTYPGASADVKRPTPTADIV